MAQDRSYINQNNNNNNGATLVSSWQNENLKFANPDQEFEERLKLQSQKEYKNPAKWMSEIVSGTNQLNNETFAEATSAYARELEKNLGNRALPVNYRGMVNKNCLELDRIRI